MARRKTTKEFIEEANKIHDNKYDYSLTEYIGSQKKVKIICPEHGEFEQNASDHLRGIGCKKCSNILKSKKTIKSKENFIIRAQKIHGDKYQYLGEYKGLKNNIEILCPEHGSFIKKASSHLNGVGCPQCKKIVGSHRKLNTSEFIVRAKKIHGDLYNYSKTEYIGSQKKVKIICPEHGEFEQTPNMHLRGQRCPRCSLNSRINKRKLTKLDFLKKAYEIHGRYQYNLENYISRKSKIKIICPDHGSFIQDANNHLAGSGCPKCANELNRKLKEKPRDIYIKKAQEIHGNKYSYPENIRAQEYINIKCPIHGEFKQKAFSHLMGSGCPECAIEDRKSTIEEFINRSQKIHAGKYDYSKGIYTGYQEKIKIICPEHGSFMQRPNDHLNGHGCPKCASSGFNPDKPAILYYLKDTETGLYKIGISNKSSIEERFGKAFCSNRAIALKEQSFNFGQEALEYEQEILEQFAYTRCTNDKWPERLGGRTEFFNCDILGLDLKV